jgi:hypothetical protein
MVGDSERREREWRGGSGNPTSAIVALSLVSGNDYFCSLTLG